MEQLYYTSFMHAGRQRSGFQVKAKTTRITADEERELLKLLSYRIPSGLPTNEIYNHPIALRYYPLSSQRSALICSQSNGRDENNRPGNFFAHCVITHPDDFAGATAPITYWKNAFWKKDDPLERATLRAPRPLPEYPTFMSEDIWEFLTVANRKEQFYKLLCAVLYTGRNNRPILILDDNEAVAHWIALVTFALPSSYRPLLSFATYHHEPYKSPFSIMGVTGGISADTYHTRFVLNAKQNRVSEIEDSDYAKYVCAKLMATYRYDSVLDFHNHCDNNISHPTFQSLGERLDILTAQYRTLYDHTFSPSDPQAGASLDTVVEQIKLGGGKPLSESKHEDLTAAIHIAYERLKANPSASTLRTFTEALQLLHRHDKSILRERIEQDLKLGIRLLLRDNATLASQLWPVFERVYGRDQLQKYLNQTGALRGFVTGLRSAESKTHSAFWKQLGDYFHYSGQKRTLLHEVLFATCELLQRHGRQQVPDIESAELIAHVWLIEDSGFVWEGVTTWHKQRSGNVFHWFYYSGVSHQPLPEREGNRNRLVREFPFLDRDELLEIETMRDFATLPKTQFTSRLMEWVRHLSKKPQTLESILNMVFAQNWRTLSASERRKVAVALLTDELAYAALSTQRQQVLTKTLLEGIKLDRLSNEKEVELYQRLAQSAKLSPQHAAPLHGSLALTTGQINDVLIAIFDDWLPMLQDDEYGQVVNLFADRFFNELAQHGQFLVAIYTPVHAVTFWDLYWARLQQKMTDHNEGEWCASLCRYWFEHASRDLAEKPMLLAGFSVKFPSLLNELQQGREYKHALNSFIKYAERENWFFLIESYLNAKRGGILGKLSPF